jgi:hypothetical protein
MTSLRIALIAVGVVLLFGLVFIGGNAWVKDPWDLPPQSGRYLAYDYFLVEHRWLTAAAMLIYGVLVAVVFKRQVLHSFKFEFGLAFWLRLLLCSVILVSVVLWST